MLLMFTGVAPKFDKLLESEVVIVGGRIQLLCIVKGQPAPTISWYACCIPPFSILSANMRFSSAINVTVNQRLLTALSFVLVVQLLLAAA